MESLGTKLQQARVAKNLSLEEASRLTKIRTSRLSDLESEDFSEFPSLAYAKGFLLIYGKLLEVDVTPYLDAFEGSKHVTVNGYSYLSENPAAAPAKTIVRRDEKKAPVLPVIIGVAVLVIGSYFLKLVLDIQRIAPPKDKQTAAVEGAPIVSLPTATPRPVSTPEADIVAPRALPADENESATPMAATPSPAVAAIPAVAPSVSARNSPTPAVAAPAPTAAASEPEVRRAQPVHPEDLAPSPSPKPSPTASATPSPTPKFSPTASTAPSPTLKPSPTPSASPSPRAIAAAAAASGVNRIEILPLKKTYVKAVVDNQEMQPALERWVRPTEGAVQLRGRRVFIKVLDRGAVQIFKNGKPLADGDPDVTFQ